MSTVRTLDRRCKPLDELFATLCCEGCGKLFLVTRYDAPTRRFCSRGCYNAIQRARTSFMPAVSDGQELLRLEDRIARWKKVNAELRAELEQRPSERSR